MFKLMEFLQGKIYVMKGKKKYVFIFQHLVRKCRIQLLY